MLGEPCRGDGGAESAQAQSLGRLPRGHAGMRRSRRCRCSRGSCELTRVVWWLMVPSPVCFKLRCKAGNGDEGGGRRSGRKCEAGCPGRERPLDGGSDAIAWWGEIGTCAKGQPLGSKAACKGATDGPFVLSRPMCNAKSGLYSFKTCRTILRKCQA